MFEAAASVFGAGAVGVVLSGMGRDGLIGARAIAAAGGEVLAQDSRTSVVWGMPGAVANAGLAAAVLPPARLAQRVALRNGVPLWN
jgi:two-component system chemotaxis response regulator CheB